MAESEDTHWVRENLSRWSQHRDAEALGELLRWQRDRAFATALRILGQASDAEDAVQQAFLKMMTRTRGFTDASEFKLAVYRAVTQCALDLIRANRVRARLEKAIVDIESAPRSHTLPDPEHAENLKWVWAELNALSEEQRALVVLCCQEGLSLSDASEILSVPRETLRDRLKSTLEALRARLSKRGVVSTAMLALLLQQGTAQAASPLLCEALDATLPGKPCAEIPAAQAPAIPFDFAEPIRSAVRPGWARTAATVAALLLVSAGIVWISTDVPKARTATKPVETLATAPATLTATPYLKKESTIPAPAVAETPPALPLLPARAKAKNPNAISLENVPAVVLEACSRSVPNIRLIEAELERENGQLVYEIKGRAAAGVLEIKVTPEGQVLEVEQDDDDDDNQAVVPKTKPLKPESPKADF